MTTPPDAQERAAEKEKLAEILANTFYYEGPGYGTWNTMHVREKTTWRAVAEAAMSYLPDAIAQAVQAEREACARLVETWASDHQTIQPSFARLAAALRARPAEPTGDQTLTERLREATETVARLQDMLDKDFYGPKGEALAQAEQRVAQLEQERDDALAGAHAIRCTCDGATRDARCAEIQGLAS